MREAFVRDIYKAAKVAGEVYADGRGEGSIGKCRVYGEAPVHTFLFQIRSLGVVRWIIIVRGIFTKHCFDTDRARFDTDSVWHDVHK